MKIRLLIAGVLVLAGCGSSNETAGTTTTAAAPITTTTAAAPSTTAPIAGSYYLYATSAETQGASVTIKGTTATFNSGSWVDSGKQVATVLALSQPVNVLTSASATKQIQASELAAHLPTDKFGNLYRIDGDVTTPEGLTEIYKG